MEFGKQLKDFILSSFMSLSKAEQAMLRDVINDDQDSKQEHQVRRDHIKLVSPKRFYEILERADQVQLEKYAEKMQALKEQRGITASDRSFRNQQISDMYGSVDYKFKTDNGLYQYANLVNVSEAGGYKHLRFFINEREHPSLRNQAHLLAKLGYFEITEGHLKYAYRVNRFVNIERVTPFEVALVFEATVEADGEKPYAAQDNTERLHYRRDLLSEKNKNTYTLGGSDFLLNG